MGPLTTRILALLVLALCYAPVAAAALPPDGPHLADVAVGPDGPSVDQSPSTYFLDFVLDVPQAPETSAPSSDDCADGAHAAGPTQDAFATAQPEITAAQGTLDILMTAAQVSVRGSVPHCLATWDVCDEALGALPCFYASYDVTQGRYYLATTRSLPMGETNYAWGTTVSGTTGMLVWDDCDDCPPPVCC